MNSSGVRFRPFKLLVSTPNYFVLKVGCQQFAIFWVLVGFYQNPFLSRRQRVKEGFCTYAISVEISCPELVQMLFDSGGYKNIMAWRQYTRGYQCIKNTPPVTTTSIKL